MKKFFRITKITFLTIVALCVVSILYFLISNKLFLESKNEDNYSYLQKNKVEVTNGISDKLFDKEFYQSNVFLLGEIHGYEANQKLDKELLFFLNKKLNVKYYIAEMDSLTANKLNNFLAAETKNEATLKEVVLMIGKRIPQQASKELFDKWSDIYDYNRQLKDGEKITVIGIDKNIDDNSAITRDEAMVVNFKNEIKRLNIEHEKFYGLFGFFHTLQHQAQNMNKTFASGLKESGIKITSFVSYTLDSEMYLPKNPQFPTPEDEKINWVNADGPLQLVKGINDLKTLSKPNETTLFKLNSSNSPYFKSTYLINIKSRIFGENIIPSKDSHTTDYFQYVFLLRNSKSLTKLE